MNIHCSQLICLHRGDYANLVAWHRYSRVIHGFSIVIMSNTSMNNQNPNIKTKTYSNRVRKEREKRGRVLREGGPSKILLFHGAVITLLRYCFALMNNLHAVQEKKIIYYKEKGHHMIHPSQHVLFL